MLLTLKISSFDDTQCGYFGFEDKDVSSIYLLTSSRSFFYNVLQGDNRFFELSRLAEETRELAIGPFPSHPGFFG